MRVLWQRIALFLTLGTVAAWAQDGARVTLGEPVKIPHPLLHYFPDSVFPFLPDGAGGNMMFWTDGISFRTFGPTLDRQGPAIPKDAIATGGPKGCFDGNGIWMLTAHRRSAKELIAFAHTENHVFEEPGKHAEWNYTALLTSSDNGASWTRRGPIVYSPQPRKPEFGGSGFVSATWDEKARRWLAWNGWGGNTAFVSDDPQGSPGTWHGLRNGAFVEPGVNCRRTSHLPGMNPNTASIAVHFNTYLGLYVMVFQTWGSGDIRMATSADGLSWSASRTLAGFPKGSGAAYPQIVGVSNCLAGQDATLAYSFTDHQFIARPIRFEVATPASPTWLAAHAADGQVALSWLGSFGATAYEVRRASAPDSPCETLAAGVTTTSFTDTRAANGATYHYVAVARNTAGESAPSTRATATPARPAAPPPAPAELDATPGHAEVALGWKAAPGTATYSVLRGATSGGPYETVAARLTAPAFLDKGLSNGKTYHYVVIAHNHLGKSPASSEAAATPFLPMPAPPRDLKVVVAGGALKLAWRPSEVALTYEIRRAVGGGSFEPLAAGLIPDSYTDTTARPGVKYRYTVTARNFFGESAPCPLVEGGLAPGADRN